MDPRYEAYTIADPTWYEPLELSDDSDSRFAEHETPDGWRRTDQGVWTLLAPTEPSEMLEQGWKIHISGTPDTAEETIKIAGEILCRLRIPWKFLRSRLIVTMTNSKYASRSGSGKVITVYPRTGAELHTALVELDGALRGRPGPYVLSDLRWNDGPLSIRFGAFTLRWCELPDGTRVPAMRDPAGRLVPDTRRPVFTVPKWAYTPDFIASRLATTPSGGDATLGRFQVTAALHFSNAGGVYLAHDPMERQVVLKEARPHAGLDRNGQDAVARLSAEREVLERLDDLSFTPDVIDYFTEWEHHYLAMEHIPGETLNAWMGREYPLTQYRPSDLMRSEFARLAVDRLEQVERCVEELHGAGIAFGDLHPRNIIVRPDGTVALVDFELATAMAADRRAALGAPGFMDPSITSARDADLFALGCCQLAVFVPWTVLTIRNPAAVGRLVQLAESAFPMVPQELFGRMKDRLALSAALRPHLLASGGEKTSAPPQPQRGQLVRGMLAAATPHRLDRLYPGDIALHRPGGSLGLAFGAPGVLLAQDVAGAKLDPDHVDWVVRAARRAPDGIPTGLYDGLAGAAWLLHRLHHPEAANLVDRIIAAPMPRSPGLFGGLTGIAQMLLDVGAQDEALRLAHETAARIGEPGVLDRPGLMHGWSGPAILFARCHQVTGHDEWAEAAEKAIRCDLRRARLVGEMLQMESSHRLLPYLAEGSAGVAFAAMALPAAQAATLDVDRIVSGAARACAVQIVIQGGLFNGRAGLVYFLAHAANRQPQWRAAAHEQSQLLALHVVARDDGHVLHGDQLVRLSVDLATGSAGALLAVEATTSSGQRLLPGVHLDVRVNAARNEAPGIRDDPTPDGR